VERFTLVHMLHFVPIRPPSFMAAGQRGHRGVGRETGQEGQGSRTVQEQSLWESPVFVGQGSLHHAGQEVGSAVKQSAVNFFL
jgi:hypothetical protein